MSSVVRFPIPGCSLLQGSILRQLAKWFVARQDASRPPPELFQTLQELNNKQGYADPKINRQRRKVGEMIEDLNDLCECPTTRLVGRHFKIDHAAALSNLNELEAMGLVKKHRQLRERWYKGEYDGSDYSAVTLTKAGRDLIEKYGF